MLTGLPCLLMSTAAISWMADGACLPDALPPREKITIDGVEMPLGVWIVGDWSSAWLVSNVFRIIAEDVLGYEVVFSPPGRESPEAIRALAGCSLHQDCLFEDSKREPVRRYHVALETYSAALSEYHLWLKMRPDKTPVRIEDIGYYGVEGTFIPDGIVSAGFQAGVSLQVYSSYNMSLHENSQFFSDVRDINTDMLLPCSSSLMMDLFAAATQRGHGFEKYAKAFPNDVRGYSENERVFVPACFEGPWWFAPACRDNVQKCIPWITLNTWQSTEQMQRAARYNMPLAIGFAANWTSYALLSRRHRVLTYWWSPDDTFTDLGMHMMVYPIDEGSHFGQTWTDRGHLPKVLDKWVAKDLRARAGVHLARRLQLGQQDMQDMLDSVAAGNDAYKAACEWFQRGDTKPTWETWFPRATDCMEGQGLANAAGDPVSEATEATQCVWCADGFVSAYYSSAGFLCTPCSPGKSFNAQWASCQDCDAGRFSDSLGQTQCQSCGSGRYAASRGMSTCDSCPVGFITEGTGETNSTGCVCEQGQYLSQGQRDGTSTCQACPWLHSTTSSGARSREECHIDLDQVTQVGLMVFALACLGCASLAAVLYRRYRQLVQDDAMHCLLEKGMQSISVPQHPMCLMPFICFCDLSEDDLAACYEGARDRGSLVVLDTQEDIREFKDSGQKVLFFSYAWTSWEKLGPNLTQLVCMKHAAERLRVTTDVDPEELYIWLDILGIPQANDRCKKLAVDSLFVYASQSDYLVVICPESRHEQTDEVVGLENYKSRIWCRVEQMAHISRQGIGSMWYSTRPGELTAVDEGWFQDVVHIFDGQVTCCRLGHQGGRECDRQLLVPTVLAMYTVLVRRSMSPDGAPSGVQAIWHWMNADRSHTFPQTFSYNDLGKLRTRKLFGSSIDKLVEVMTHTGAPALLGRTERQSITGLHSFSDGHGMSTPRYWLHVAKMVMSKRYHRRLDYTAQKLVQAADQDQCHQTMRPTRTWSTTSTHRRRFPRSVPTGGPPANPVGDPPESDRRSSSRSTAAALSEFATVSIRAFCHGNDIGLPSTVVTI
eukprot:TRINITY_DN3655_c0_g1_i3.p1 TRINITY_DN3655_c0_g1~~TRINITY_DN3655_c0_g1_i3.p1  ORF type:complete len:1055 (+),score=66.82 TRINITY_DN3655_c0_g1_i3:179-3343(+)